MEAAKQNDVNALFNLGVMYNDGNCVTKKQSAGLILVSQSRRTK